MAFIPDDPSTITQAQVASYATRFPGKATGTEDFIGKISRAEAQGLWAFQKKLQRVSIDTVPNSQMSYDRLSDWAVALGLPNGPPGTATGYGPLKAIPATGLVGLATGSNGRLIPAGSQMVAPDGSTLFQTTVDATIVGTSIHVSFEAITAGTSGNLQSGVACTFISPPAGVQSTVAVTTGTTTGADQESGPALLARVLERLQFPPKGGSMADWYVWATTPVVSIARAYGYPRRHGTGTVDMVVTNPFSGNDYNSRDPGTTDTAKIATYIDTVRPVTTEGRNILRPYFAPNHGLTIQTRIVPLAPYGTFDWVSSGLGLTVTSYKPAATAPITSTDVLTLSGPIPDDLLRSITNNIQSGIQIVSTGTGYGVFPVVVHGMIAVQGANGVITLKEILTTALPQTGNPVFSNGPACAPIQQAQLDYINGLGPSRQSGFADADNGWNDSVETAQLSRIALDTADGNSNSYANNIVKTAGVEQITIAVGGNAATTNDYQTTDDYVHAPEVAYAVRVTVTD